ncbi:MAG: hypothetical protein DHS20C19_10700 [Acidimicrobiales bacterium]|nr:MAG: hypothetical protein DHS20C19_10700 [Acidimicrobiales bacterium]
MFNRGARRLPIFGDDDDRRLFLHHVSEAIERVTATIHAYALMPNHYHLLVEADVPHLSLALKRLSEQYTRWFNDKYGLDGPLFRGRFQNKPIITDRQRLATLRYIHCNPAEGAPADSWRYEWTSHPAYLGRATPPPWLATSLVNQLGGVDAYRLWIQGVDIAAAPTTARPESTSTVKVGTPEAVEWALGIGSDPERLLLRQGGRGVRNDLRAACALLASELTVTSSDDLAARYGFRSGSGLRTAATRARRRAADEPAFAAMIAAARRRLSAPRAA